MTNNILCLAKFIALYKDLSTKLDVGVIEPYYGFHSMLIRWFEEIKIIDGIEDYELDDAYILYQKLFNRKFGVNISTKVLKFLYGEKRANIFYEKHKSDEEKAFDWFIENYKILKNS